MVWFGHAGQRFLGRQKDGASVAGWDGERGAVEVAAAEVNVVCAWIASVSEDCQALGGRATFLVD